MKRALILANTASMIDLFNKVNLDILQKENYEIHVMCNFESGNTTSAERVEGCKKEWIKRGIIYHQTDFLRTPFSLKWFKIYRQVKNLICSMDFDIIHCHTPIVSAITRLAAIKSHKQGTRIIYTAHGFHFYNGCKLVNWITYFTVEKILSHVTDTLITINDEDYKRAVKHFNAKEIIYVPGIGIDTKKISAALPGNIRDTIHLKKDDKLIISIGELIDRKNHRTVIDAVKKMNREDIHDVIIGIGHNLDKLSKYVQKNNLCEKVHFMGFRTDIYEILKSCDVFAFPSHQEGLPVALMEAMACGLPAVVSKIRGNTDLIDDGRGGYLYNQNDTEGFAEGIQKILADPAMQSSMGEYNRIKVKAYSEQKVSDMLAKIYFGYKDGVTNEAELYSSGI